MKKLVICCLIVLALVLPNYDFSARQIVFDSAVFNKIEEPIWLPPEKYGMALWLLNHYDFLGKSKEEICRDLYAGKAKMLTSDLADDVISIPLRNKSIRFWGLPVYYDETREIVDAYMKIYLQADIVRKVELVELDSEKKWVLVKSIGK